MPPPYAPVCWIVCTSSMPLFCVAQWIDSVFESCFPPRLDYKLWPTNLVLKATGMQMPWWRASPSASAPTPHTSTSPLSPPPPLGFPVFLYDIYPGAVVRWSRRFSVETFCSSTTAMSPFERERWWCSRLRTGKFPSFTGS